MSLRAALVHSLILEIYIICLFIILVVGPLLAQDVLRITLKTLAVMLAAAIAHWCLNRGLLRLAGIFLITFAWLKVAESIFNSWGPLSPQLVLMPVLVAMAAFILGTRAALIFAFASLLFGAAMVIFQPNEAAMARPWPPPPHVVVVALAIGLACLIWPLSVMFGTLRATLSQLKVSETRFRSLATGAHVVSAVIDANGVFLLSEGLALARLGLKPGEVVGRSVFDAYSDYPEILDIIRAGLRGESHRTEIALMDAWFDSLFLPQFDARGHITELFIVSTDITERKRAEAEREKLAGRLRQGQVLESVGRLAGGVAHDLNNMLTPILGFAEMLREEFPAGDPRAAQLGHIHSAAKRARQITTQLLAFARRQPTDMRIHDLNTILGDFDPMLRRAVREDIRLVSHLHRAPLFILCDVLEIERILLNL
ncbi:MAG: PAS domain S-box protein, partial [Acidobacteria bacterium]|nr:PAS domain S-box protein [Acidobacteriota bacterium]